MPTRTPFNIPACPCCGGACVVPYDFAADLEWADPDADLDLFVAYDGGAGGCPTYPGNAGSGIYPSPTPGKVCVGLCWCLDGHDLGGVGGGNGTPFAINVAGLGAAPAFRQDGGQFCGTTPLNEHVTGSSFVRDVDGVQRLWAWYNVITGCVGALVVPTVKTARITNRSTTRNLIVNGGAVAPGAAWTAAIGSKGFEDKTAGRFDYFFNNAGAAAGWTTIMDLQCGGLAA